MYGIDEFNVNDLNHWTDCGSAFVYGLLNVNET